MFLRSFHSLSGEEQGWRNVEFKDSFERSGSCQKVLMLKTSSISTVLIEIRRLIAPITKRWFTEGMKKSSWYVFAPTPEVMYKFLWHKPHSKEQTFRISKVFYCIIVSTIWIENWPVCAFSVVKMTNFDKVTVWR